jgi:histidyl-tRNA synthetase
MLAYGTAADMLDEYLKVAETIALECLENFVQGVVEIFGGEYLRSPTIEEVEHLLQVGESRGFPGML